MFNLLCVRSAAIPRLERLLNDPSTPAEQKFILQDQLEHERNKSQKGAMENSLRRHNLLPVVFQLFKSLGESSMAGEYTIEPLFMNPTKHSNSQGCRGRSSKGKRKAGKNAGQGRGQVTPFGRRHVPPICHILLHITIFLIFQ